MSEPHWLPHVFLLCSWLFPSLAFNYSFSHLTLSLTLWDENVMCHSEASAKITLQSAK